MTSVPTPVWHLAIVAGALGSLVALVALARPRGRWGARVRSRLVLGVPLGSLLSVALVLGVYLFVQNGLDHWAAPTEIPYRAWSYFYPLGIVVSPFAHAGPGHLIGNVVGTVTFGALAEYAWSHFPDERGTRTFSTLGTNPYARALAFFGGVLAVGLLTGIFSFGPAIGFSGVVFAFVGFALVRYPLGTVLVLVAGDVVALVHRALRSPESTASAGERFVTPWFADIAVQGHYFGLLLGVVLGVALVRRRGVRPPPGRLWFATLVFAVDQSLWALYLPQSASRFLLLRALGLVVVFVLAALVTAGATARDRPLVARLDLSTREAATGLLLAVLLAVSIVAVPLNVLAVDAPDTDADGSVEVRDYEVYYAEDVRHGLVPTVTVLGEDTEVNVSGVVVVSERRAIWWPEVTAAELAARGRATIPLGGPGWRVPVRATRTGWNVLGGGTAYEIYLRAGDRDRRLAFASEPATVDATVAGRNLSIAPTGGAFEVVVSRGNRTIDRAPVPAAPNGTATIGGLRVVREGRDLFAVAGGDRNATRIRVARRSAG